MTLNLMGIVNIPVQEYPRVHLLSTELALILDKSHVTLIQMVNPAFLTEHQRKKHTIAFNLSVLEHFMPDPDNHIYLTNGHLL
jgi:hypothetical protein